ncbi:type I-F CRISPR-associated endoribonuclease Cas6/Csy4 [Pseudoalteromonas espejiana]
MKRYYLTITYLPKNCDVSLLAGRCIGILHGFMSSREISNIGVCFPKWNEQTIGSELAFVSTDKKQLIHLSQQSYFEMMAHDKLFDLSKILEVPVNQSEVMFVRNQSVAKAFVGEKQRRLKRAKKELKPEAKSITLNINLRQSTLATFIQYLYQAKATGKILYFIYKKLKMLSP